MSGNETIILLSYPVNVYVIFNFHRLRYTLGARSEISKKPLAPWYGTSDRSKCALNEIYDKNIIYEFEIFIDWDAYLKLEVRYPRNY